MAGKMDDVIANNMKQFLAIAAGFLVFMVAAGVAIFFVIFRGGEQVMVPNVQGRDLTHALQELQVRELNARIQLRYSPTPHDRGQVLEQDPVPGQIVRVGRNIQLTVSQGAVINRMDNFVGRNIDAARMDLQAFAFGSIDGPLLVLREPIIFDYSHEPAGTILHQSPEAGANITGPTHVEFVVSLGPQQAMMTVPQLAGLPLAGALGWIGGAGVVFEFFIRDAWEGETGGTVVQQSPAPGSAVTTDTRINLTVAAPESVPEGSVFRLFAHTLAPNPFPLPVRLEALLPTGEVLQLISVDSIGGRFTVPYLLPVNSILILYMMDREIHRTVVW